MSGDPRRPNETHAFKMLPPTAEDQTPGALLLLAVGFGMAALLLKVLHKQICPWSDLILLKATITTPPTLQRHHVPIITSAKTSQLMSPCVCAGQGLCLGWCRLHCHVCCQHQQCRIGCEVYHECRLVSDANPSYVLLCLILQQH